MEIGAASYIYRRVPFQVTHLPQIAATTAMGYGGKHHKAGHTNTPLTIVNCTPPSLLKLAAQNPTTDIRTITLEKNLRKGGVVRHGMLHARGRLLMVDADGASRFEDLEVERTSSRPRRSSKYVMSFFCFVLRRISGRVIDARAESVRFFETPSCTDSIPSSA